MKNQTPDAIDLDAYFQRIGYSGDCSPTLLTLQAIHQHHAQAIAFENLNSFLSQPVLLDVTSLQQKLIEEGRGGYCFEQNRLLGSVLRAFGFQVTNLAARVLWNLPLWTITPRTHMLLQVDIDSEKYIADVGFGGLTLTSPLSLTPDIEQSTPHEPFRLIATDQTLIMQAYIGQEWKSLEGVTKALEGLLYKVEGSQPPLIKRKLIANKMEAFCHPFLTQVKSSYPIVTI